MSELPLVSIVIPCRNEEVFIGRCLDSILANDYPTDRLEVLVIDGLSTDRTREIVARYVERYAFIKLLTNPRKVTSAALNLGIKHANGDLIMWMSAHATYNEGYISSCVKALERYDADNVGGITLSLPRNWSRIGKAIAATFSHPLGSGNARYRMQVAEPTWVDTVFGGCYRREVFQRIGLFNEKLVRSQDVEFNVRLQKAGGRILLVPEAVAYYYIRSDLLSFVRHNWLNGMWAVLPLAYSNVVPVSWRHLVPLGLVSSVLVTGALGALFPPVRWFFSGIVGAYIMATLAGSAGIAWRRRDPWMLLLMPIAFASLHLPYGFGSLWGLLQTLWLLTTGKASRGGAGGVAEASH